MKNYVVLLIIGLFAAMAVSISLSTKNQLISVGISSLVYFLIPYIFYSRIKNYKIGNSIILFFGLILLLTFGFLINPANKITWIAIFISSVIPYFLAIRLRILYHAKVESDKKNSL